MDKVLERVVPADKEVDLISRVSKKALLTAKKFAQEVDSKIQVKVEGSVAKGTWLKGSGDVDVFVLFPLEYADQDIEKFSMPLLEKIGKSLGGVHVKYAQHPYIETEIEGIKVEFVPGFNTNPDAIISAVDRTPYHTSYVMEHLEDPNQARLLKQFCKGVGVYGAEQSTLGFSGYLCELLIIKFGTFMDALENISRWRTEGLIIPDPVDIKRNVAAAVSQGKLRMLVRAARAFLNDPSLEFFFPNPAPVMKPQEFNKALGDRFVQLLVLEKPDADSEVIASQVRSFTNRLSRFLDDDGYGCVHAWQEVGNKIYVLFESEDDQLPLRELRMGPPGKLPQHAAEFWDRCMDNGTCPWLVNDRWQAYTPRRFSRLKDALTNWLSGLDGPKYVVQVVDSVIYYDRLMFREEYPKFEQELKQFVTVSLLDLPPWSW